MEQLWNAVMQFMYARCLFCCYEMIFAFLESSIQLSLTSVHLRYIFLKYLFSVVTHERISLLSQQDCKEDFKMTDDSELSL